MSKQTLAAQMRELNAACFELKCLILAEYLGVAAWWLDLLTPASWHFEAPTAEELENRL